MSCQLLYATDLHGNHAAYRTLFEVAREPGLTAVVLGGDLLPLPLGSGGDLVAIQKRFLGDVLEPALRVHKAAGGPPVYGVLGNDDWAACAPLVDALDAQGLFGSLHMRSLPLHEGLQIAGYSCVPLTPFRMSDWDRYDTPAWLPAKEPKRLLFSEGDSLREGSLREVRARGTIEEDLRDLARATEPRETVYVCHTPPYGTKLDLMHGGTPIGSRALRAFVEEHQPPLTLHGHVHESPRLSGAVEDRIGATVCVNPGDSRSRLRAVRVSFEGGTPTVREVEC